MMGIRPTAAFYLLLMVAVVVGVDLVFFRHHFVGRLIANAGIVLVFVLFYLAYVARR